MSDQKIMEKMYETMDVTLYNFLSKDGKTFLRKSMKDRKKHSHHLQSLLSLLEKYFRSTNDGRSVPDLKKDIPVAPKYILGPEYLVKLEYIGTPKKTIYLFGEKHVKIPEKANCGTDSYTRITPFLENLFKTSFVPIDFFLETTPRDKYTEGIYGKLNNNEYRLKRGEAQEDIRVLRYKFDECVAEKRPETCPSGVRIHYTDVRFIDTFPSLSHDFSPTNTFETIVKIAQRNLKVELPMMKEQKFFQKIYKQIRYITKYPEVRNHLSNILSKLMVDYQKAYFSGRSPLSDNTVFNEEYDTLVKTLKRSSIKLSTDLTTYTNFYEKNVSLNRLILWIDENKDSLSFRSTIKNSVISCLEETQYFFEEFSEQFLDLYTVSRMFRSFQGSYDPINIIFYGGSFHSKNIASILKATGKFKITEFSAKGNPACIDISNIQLF